jgi:hypothetical protein
LTPPELQFLLKPAEIQRDPILTIRAVTHIYVSDRQEPLESGVDGTEMARRPVNLNALSPERPSVTSIRK